MGKPIISQRRGKGTSVFISPSHLHKGEIKYRKYDELEKTGAISGIVKDIIPAAGRSCPLVKVIFEDGTRKLMLGMEGIKVGDTIEIGAAAPIKMGNSLPLSKIPEGTPICNIENHEGDGGKMVRASGTYGLLVSHEGNKVVIKMPSGQMKTLSEKCRATIGVVAGGGRRDKPIMKAGKMWHMLRPTARYWPIVRKIRMNSFDHPYGGNSGSPGKPKTVSRDTPPGRKVGLIAARRTGRR